ncbi:MAG: hypothetical protein EOP83_17180 [Verrucomicrobiaceae bacterium]|nr:MAG: hypothetical protein EOP83_17180 [Verrucomicrobiaceae bacterium]
MFGFSPGTFRRRELELDMGEVYETIEGPWLASFIEYHAERVDRTGVILDVTQGGLSTGILFMSETTADNRQRRLDWSFYAADEMRRTIDAEIVAQLVADMETQVYQATAMPSGMLSSADMTTPEALKAHERMLKKFPAPGTKAARLRGLGVAI